MPEEVNDTPHWIVCRLGALLDNRLRARDGYGTTVFL